jgi:hypothetical protein
MTISDDFASEHRRRLIDDYDRQDNRAIAYILIAVALLGAGVFLVLVVLDVTGDDPVARAKPTPATVVPAGSP